MTAASAEEAPIVERKGEPDVVWFATTDAEMNAAMAEARKTFAAFVARIPELSASETYYSIKVALPVDGGYTVLVARARMPDAERAEFDAGITFDIPVRPRAFDRGEDPAARE